MVPPTDVDNTECANLPQVNIYFVPWSFIGLIFIDLTSSSINMQSFINLFPFDIGKFMGNCEVSSVSMPMETTGSADILLIDIWQRLDSPIDTSVNDSRSIRAWFNHIINQLLEKLNFHLRVPWS
ncbi:hypothetical protein ABZP36_012236 [Zizania latifolia]